MASETGRYVGFSRKWRPQQFDDVVGQEHISKALQNAIKLGRIFSGYLFCGPRGIGKTSTARILAKALNCVEGPTPTPCGVCEHCKEITIGSSMDVLEIDGASNTSVDSIRELRENVSYSPYSSKYKVYIIDEVHMLSQSAFNALLKTLEEPPPFVTFIFATTEPHKIPETIISRCQVYYFNRISNPDITNRLSFIIDREGIKINPDQKEMILGLIAINSEGGMRDAQVLLDQLVSLGDGTVTLENLQQFLGLIDNQIMLRTLKMILEHDTKDLLFLVNDLVNNGKSIEHFTKQFIKFLRDLLILKAGGSQNLIDIKGTFLEELAQQIGEIPYATIVNILNNFFDLEEKLKGVVQSRFLLEFTLIKLSVIEPVESIQSLLEKLESIEKSIAEGKLIGTNPQPQQRPGMNLPSGASLLRDVGSETRYNSPPQTKFSPADRYSASSLSRVDQSQPTDAQASSTNDQPTQNASVQVDNIEPIPENLVRLWEALCRVVRAKKEILFHSVQQLVPLRLDGSQLVVAAASKVDKEMENFIAKDVTRSNNLSLIEEQLKKISETRMKLKVVERKNLTPPEVDTIEKNAAQLGSTVESLPTSADAEQPPLAEENAAVPSQSAQAQMNTDAEPDLNTQIMKISLVANQQEIKKNLMKKAVQHPTIKTILDVLGGDVTDVQPKLT